MDLLRLEQANLHFGTHVLLDNVDLQISSGQRLGLLGRNGEGKSTLLKILAGDLALDGGERWLRPGTRIARLEQELPKATDITVYDYVADGLAETGALLRRFEQLVSSPDADLVELERVQHALEAADGWQLGQRVDTTLTQLDLQRDTPMASLSGGWRRRASLARALVSDPDILLLDEPTNHLDIPAIEWLQEQLTSLRCALVLITHDRRFLSGVADHIAELDRGGLTVWQGSYDGFLTHREHQLAAEERANALFDRRLSDEEKWIRQGIKARRTRNEGRVRALKTMREERSARRERTGTANLNVDNAQRSGKIVVELKEASAVLGGRRIIKPYSMLLQRGDRVGVVGPNGAGKSTLIRLLTGELAPHSGSVRLGSKLEIAYGDQGRSTLDPTKNLIDNVCGGRDFIEIGGRRKHAVSYLGDFLFSPQRLRTPVGALSGGEQNRAVLALLFSKPVNLLVLDEPTNDLDIETLELLEELLMEFKGTVLLVSHDRAFMDNVVTSLLVLSGDGGIEEHAGGFSDWEARGGRLLPLEAMPHDAASSAEAKPAEAAVVEVKPNTQKKLSYKEQRELDALPGEIETLESRQSELESLCADHAFYERDAGDVKNLLAEMSGIAEKLEATIERWTELEERA
ncbi:MAG: ATP-binding cassette subfamily F protein uup [Glaciecola sp.]|jgi:ATP-binding cassette subfamily F protein uup|uniref:ATP-binding cassette domain-containing protein n=1 Tax=Congregibacter sp. TaxID=2744308 RepID=UPI0039E4D237